MLATRRANDSCCRTQLHSSSPHISLRRRRRSFTTEDALSTARVVFHNKATFDLSAEYLLTQHRNLGVQQFAYDWRCKRQPQMCAPPNPSLCRTSCDKRNTFWRRSSRGSSAIEKFHGSEFSELVLTWPLHTLISSSGVSPLATTPPRAAPVALRDVCTELDTGATSAVNWRCQQLGAGRNNAVITYRKYVQSCAPSCYSNITLDMSTVRMFSRVPLTATATLH